MKVLYYYWSENSAYDMISSLIKMGHQVKKIDIPFDDYENDVKFAFEFQEELEKDSYDFVFSFDFFPGISRVAQNMGIKYVSWVYDMPHLTLFSPQLRNSVNYIFIFDYSLYNMLKDKKYPCHVYHLPLAVNTDRIIERLGMPKLNNDSKYEVSFVGSLYENCLYNQIKYLPEYLKEYLNLGIQVQRKVHGYNCINEVLNDDITKQLEKWVKLDIPNNYDITYKEMFTDLYNAKITSEERIDIINSIARTFPLVLFTGSKQELVPDVELGGTIDYVTEMPIIFRTSKINLNITLRSITSGIPLRALDIMGAGGFLLSNYQNEIAENFRENEECVLFRHEEDMMNKIEYYLSHDKERGEIAYNGFCKVKKEFSYERQIKKIFKKISEEL